MNHRTELDRFKRAEAQTKLASCHVDWEFYCSATKKEWIISMTIGDTDSPTALIDTRVQEWNVIATTGDTTVPYHCKQTCRKVMDSFFWYSFDKPSIHMDQVHPGVFQQLMPTARRMAHDDPVWGGEK